MQNHLAALMLGAFILAPVIKAQNVSNSPVAPAQVQKTIHRFLSTDGLQAAGVGLDVKEVETGTTIAQYQPRQCRIPASTMKILTTATALETLSDSFCFATRLTYTGYIKDSVLHGDLYIVGGGDPSLESDFFPHSQVFTKMEAAIKRGGINRIDGKIIGDGSLYTQAGLPTQWLLEDVGTYYGQTPSALSFNDNLLFLTYEVDSAGKPRLEAALPRNRMLKINSRLNVSNDKWWRVYGDSYSWYKTIRGQIPAGRKTVITIENPEPALMMADSLSHVLLSHGVRNLGSGTTRWTGMRGPQKPCLYIHYSLPLRDIIATTNHKSVNLFAENILLYLGLQNSSDSICDYDKALSTVRKHWSQKGMDCSHIYQADGSGLSMKNAMTPEFMTNLLVYMKKQSKEKDAFVNSFASAGVDGTVKTFLKGTPLSGKVLAKSGSMDRVQNFCGYIILGGKWYAFTFYVNNFDCSRKELRTAMAQLLNSLYHQPQAAHKGKTNRRK